MGSDNIASRGSSALELIQRLAKTMAAAEAQLEERLQNVMLELTAAENIGAALTQRATQAESRAAEAEQWLRRLHARLQKEFASAKRLSALSMSAATLCMVVAAVLFTVILPLKML